MHDTLLKLADEMLINSAHDCSDGGLAVTLTESCFSSLGREAVGASIELGSNGLSHDALLFSESPSRIVISFSPEKLDKVKQVVGDCPFEAIGMVGNDALRIYIDGAQAVSSSIAELEAKWETSLGEQLEI